MFIPTQVDDFLLEYQTPDKTAQEMFVSIPESHREAFKVLCQETLNGLDSAIWRVKLYRNRMIQTMNNEWL